MQAGALLIVGELHQDLFLHTIQLEFSFEAIRQIGIIKTPNVCEWIREGYLDYNVLF